MLVSFLINHDQTLRDQCKRGLNYTCKPWLRCPPVTTIINLLVMTQLWGSHFAPVLVPTLAVGYIDQVLGTTSPFYPKRMVPLQHAQCSTEIMYTVCWGNRYQIRKDSW